MDHLHGSNLITDVDIACRRIELHLKNHQYALAHRIISDLELSQTGPHERIDKLDIWLTSILPERYSEILYRRGIRQVRDLINTTQETLLSFRSLDLISVQIIRSTIDKLFKGDRH